MQFHERVQKYEYKLNDTDDQIIEYILNHKKEITTLPIQTLANQLYTVPNTIMRLAKKLGYDGFSHLKNSLKNELENDQQVVQSSSFSYIQKTFELIDHELLSNAAKLMKEAKHVLLFAVGDNVDFCYQLKRNLQVIDQPSYFSVHRHETLYYLKKMGPKDVLFCISLSGKTPLVLEIAEEAKKRGVQIISLTHFIRNPLQQMADIPLYCYAPRKEMNGYNITDPSPIMVVLYALSQIIWTTY
ncbi:MurR/RpiR family transcriptional regulator [Fervidibacillus halotolerans]|uniref:MurR/RpiR family transcriptional regulator n=1 Tax=Fervidibacillus halotolerans TaxID=2980027 RepID=A0A9E8LZ61_9BACI|nr:MurR/RpiR family transcriptional regulator [Fervidibacillus halotolerans]WAA12097.1 MurR/RpiR family transcriptional regulator [Fervidibacillus halotolerans]